MGELALIGVFKRTSSPDAFHVKGYEGDRLHCGRGYAGIFVLEITGTWNRAVDRKDDWDENPQNCGER